MAILSLFLVGAFQANAEMTVKEYRTRMAVKDSPLAIVTKVYVQGLGEGLVLANDALQKDGKALLFCMPEKLSLNRENVVSMIDKEIAHLLTGTTRAQVDQWEVSSILYVALKETFPCTGK